MQRTLKIFNFTQIFHLEKEHDILNDRLFFIRSQSIYKFYTKHHFLCYKTVIRGAKDLT